MTNTNTQYIDVNKKAISGISDSNTIVLTQSELKDLEKKIARKLALRALISGLIVILFATIVFGAINLLNKGNADFQPIAQIKQDGKWVIIREPSYTYTGWFVDQNATGVDFIQDDENGIYDLVIHYTAVGSMDHPDGPPTP